MRAKNVHDATFDEYTRLISEEGETAANAFLDEELDKESIEKLKGEDIIETQHSSGN